MGTKNSHDGLANGGRQHILGTELNHAWASVSTGCKESREIEIVREDDPHVLPSPGRQRGIGSPMGPDGAPVDGMEAMTSEELDPGRGEVHVQKQLHGRGSSDSSVRHAAYVSAARTSSGSKYGYAIRISCSEWPAASRPKTVPTVTRIPRMQGRPPMTRGSCVMRRSSSMRAAYPRLRCSATERSPGRPPEPQRAALPDPVRGRPTAHQPRRRDLTSRSAATSRDLSSRQPRPLGTPGMGVGLTGCKSPAGLGDEVRLCA